MPGSPDPDAGYWDDEDIVITGDTSIKGIFTQGEFGVMRGGRPLVEGLSRYEDVGIAHLMDVGIVIPLILR